MLSPTRAAAEAVLKNIVATTAAALHENASATMEPKEDSNDGEDDEPAKKKFKDDTQTEVKHCQSQELLCSMDFSGGNIGQDRATSAKATEKTKSLHLLWLLW